MTYKHYNTHKKGKEKFNGKTYYEHNKGSMLEDLIHERLCKDDQKFKCDRYFLSIKENVEFEIDGVKYEMDNFALHVNNNSKTYALLFEDKLGNGSKSKAHKQLRRQYHYALRNSNIDRIFLFYVHGFNKKRKTYTIEWYKPYSNINNKTIKDLLEVNDFLCKKGGITKQENNKRKARLYESYDKRNSNYKKMGLEWKL